MDTLTLVITALTTGSAASVRETASESLKEAYTGLKALIQQKCAGRAAAEIVLAQHEARPDMWRTPLEEELMTFCQRHLARFKCPRSIDFENDFPRLPTGKLYKNVLRDRYWGGKSNRIL